MTVLWSSRAGLGGGQFLVLPQHGDSKVNTVPYTEKGRRAAATLGLLDTENKLQWSEVELHVQLAFSHRVTQKTKP